MPSLKNNLEVVYMITFQRILLLIYVCVKFNSTNKESKSSIFMDDTCLKVIRVHKDSVEKK